MKHLTISMILVFFIASVITCEASETYYGPDGSLTITQLKDGKMHFEFSLVNSQGNMGMLEGTTEQLRGNAFYNSADCELAMQISDNTVLVIQNLYKGNCEAGMNVVYDGVYKKKVPKPRKK